MVGRAQRDPVWFAREILGVHLWEMQAEILRTIWRERRVSVKSANGVGKSFLGAVAVLAYGSIFPDAVIITTATTFKQVKGILFREIGRLAHRSRIHLGAEVLSTEVRWAHGSVALGMTAPEHDVSKIQGFRGDRTLIVADEAGGLAQPIVEGIQAMLTGENVRLLMIGNPTDPTSDFAKSFSYEGVESFSISAFDTPNFTAFGITQDDIAAGSWRAKVTGPLPAPHLTTPEWVRDRYEDWGPEDPRYIARVLARFPDEGSDSLYPMRFLEAAIERELLPSELEKDAPNHLGVDVARSGDDDTVIYHRHGPIARRVAKIHGHDTMSVAGAVVRARKDSGATQIKVDEIGVGAGVVDRLKELGEPVFGVNVGTASRDPEQFVNLRSELFWGLRKRFDDGGIVLGTNVSRDLVRQLHAMRWKPNSRGQVVVEPKDETKKRLDGRSPDEADALMLAFADVEAKRYWIV